MQESASQVFFPSVVFLQSSSSPDNLPPDRGVEVAFAGRSNAGKSSTLNAITGRRALARTSKTPGRTRLINFFALDPLHRLVDLPGYGYAKVSESVKESWQESMATFLESRQCLRGLILVLDIRLALTPLDRQMLVWCHRSRMPVHLLANKCEKLSRAAAGRSLDALRNEVTAIGMSASAQLFSATSRQGVDEARALILEWLELSVGHKKNPGNKGRESGVRK